LVDAQRVLAAHRPLSTWSGRYPTHRIDHVFVDPSVEVVSIEVPNTELEKLASDHLPVIVEVRILAETAAESSVPARHTNGQARQPG
jgi:endonuclease/exonuclease/phosphatase family metal-dependent hydrolase